MNSDIKELQKVQLELLDELMRICKAHDINYYLACGSCLGAVRHQGFIPWDDDIDVFMYAKDAEALFQYKDEFSDDFFLQNAETDPGFNMSIARLRKRGTALVEPGELDVPCHHGIYMDIYPLYYYPESFLGRAKMIFQGVCRNILLGNRPPLNHGAIVKLVGKLILLPYKNEGVRNRKILKLSKRIRSVQDTDRLVTIFGMDISLRGITSYKTEWFGFPKYLKFEGRSVPVATNYDAYLRTRYGDDYMQLPPEEKQHSYHNYVYLSFTKELDDEIVPEIQGIRSQQ